jgi:3-deoxy-D-manno-octulosonic-acid transferase
MKKFNLFLALLIYNLFIVPLLFIAFHILGLFNKKIKTGIKGRKNLLKKFETEVKQKIDPQKPTFWFHSSSLGEFEQAKPIIRKLKESFNPNVIATFFSPSGYEHSKNYPFADIISYIPFDSVFTAKKFISLIKSPRTYLFLMKYDLWPNHLFFARKADFTLCLANAIIDERKTSSMFKRFFSALFTRCLTSSF